MPVRLHDVELRTEVFSQTSMLVGITILERVFPIIKCRHAHDSDLRDTTTADIAQIDVILDRATYKIRTVVRVYVMSSGGRQVHSFVQSELDSLIVVSDG